MRKRVRLTVLAVVLIVTVAVTVQPAIALCGFGYQTCNWFCAQEAERVWQACGARYGQFLQECMDQAQEVYNDCTFDCTMYFCSGYPPV